MGKFKDTRRILRAKYPVPQSFICPSLGFSTLMAAKTIHGLDQYAKKTPAWENQAGAVAVGRKKSELDGLHSVSDGDAFVVFAHSAAGKVVAGRVAVVNGSTDLAD